MSTLKSKVSIVQSLVFGFLVLFFGFLGMILIVQSINTSTSKRTFSFIAGTGLILFCISSIKYFLKNFPSVEITNDSVVIKSLFSKQTIKFTDIHLIVLMKKSPVTFWGMTIPMESTIIMTNDLKKTIIVDDYYRNISEIKYRLEQIKHGLKNGNFEFKNETKLSTTFIDLRLEEFIHFKGSSLLNFNALIFWGFTLFMIILFGRKLAFDLKSMILFTSLTGLFYVISGMQLNYYLVSDNYLQVKNHLWFWKKKTYQLKDIKEIVLEEPHRVSKSVRIKTNDFKSSLHPGGSLRKKNWLELKNELKEKGVKVRDELVHWG